MNDTRTLHIELRRHRGGGCADTDAKTGHLRPMSHFRMNKGKISVFGPFPGMPERPENGVAAAGML
jgi:hypothetical protein